MMPAILQSIAHGLPFIYGGYLVGYLFVRFDTELFWETAAIHVFWILLLLGANMFVYGKGAQRLSVN